MKIKSGKYTMKGRRDENQDDCAVIEGPRGIVAVVCDGLGGHAGGAEAARVAVEAVRQATLAWTECTSSTENAAWYLVHVAEQAVRALHRDPRLGEAMTTIVLWVLAFDEPGVCAVAHVGDSRAYLHRAGELQQLTADHALGRHTLAACLGSQGGPDSPDVRHLICAPGDAFLLCSDGLHGTLSDAMISDGLHERRKPTLRTGSDMAENLCRWAFHDGSQDNITAVLVSLTP